MKKTGGSSILSKIGIFIFLTLVFVGGVVPLVMAFHAFQDCLALESRGIPTTATIMDVRHEYKSPQNIIFSFNVNGTEYNGHAEFDDKYGYEGLLKIKYLPENPEVADPNPAHRRYQAMLALILMSCWNALYICVVGGSIWTWFKRKRTAKTA
ncbi:MAG TPA: hypothetical protein VGL56_04530 [Fimbriimonadaceae bacterium]|jgi:hypothetical protein